MSTDVYKRQDVGCGRTRERVAARYSLDYTRCARLPSTRPSRDRGFALCRHCSARYSSSTDDTRWRFENRVRYRLSYGGVRRSRVRVNSRLRAESPEERLHYVITAAVQDGFFHGSTSPIDVHVTETARCVVGYVCLLYTSL